MLLLALLGSALAGPARFVPDAAPARGWAASFGMDGVVVGGQLSPGLDLGLDWAPTDRWLLRATSLQLFPSTYEQSGTLGARWSALRRDGLNLGPWLGLAEHTAGSPLDTRLVARLGLAVEGGSRRVRADLSLPLVGMRWLPAAAEPVSPLGVFETLLALEGGLAVTAHSAATLRLGLTGFMPTLSWHGDFGPWFAEARAGTLGLASLGQLRVGRSWP